MRKKLFCRFVDRFKVQELLLDVNSGGVATYVVGGDHTVAGDDDDDGIGTASRGDCTRGSGVPDASSQFAIGDCVAIWDSHHGLPHRALKGCADGVDWQVKFGQLSGKILLQLM